MVVKLAIYLLLETLPSPRNVYNECIKQGLSHPEIVTKQFILETGWGKHYKYNNLFGLYNSSTHDYYKFHTWQQSVEGYRDLIQYRYKGGDYYKWLESVGYAEDSMYISKLKRIRL